MDDPTIHLSTIGPHTGIKSLSITVPNSYVTIRDTPEPFTVLANIPACQAWRVKYGDYVFISAEAADSEHTVLHFAQTGSVSEQEADPTTHDFWTVTRTLSNAADTTETGFTLKSSKEIGSGVFLNTSRTLNTQNALTSYKQTEEYGQVTTTEQYVTNPGTVSALGYMIVNEYKPINNVFGLLRQSTFNGPVTRNEREKDSVTKDEWSINRTLSTSQGSADGSGYIGSSKQINEGLYLNTRRSITLPSLVNTTKKQTEEFDLLTITDQYVAAASGATTALGYTLESSYTPLNQYFGLLHKVTFPGPITKTDTEFDPETLDKISTTRTLTTTNVTTQAVKTEVTSKQLSAGLYLITTRTINGFGSGGVPSLLVYPKAVPWGVPSLLLSLSVSGTTRASDNATSVYVNPNIRSGYETKVNGYMKVEYFTSIQSLSTLWQIRPVDLVYRGIKWAINVHNVITNARTGVGAFYGSSDPDYPLYNDKTDFPASSPTYDEYAAIVAAQNGSIANMKLISEETNPWRYGLYRRVQIWISPQ